MPDPATDVHVWDGTDANQVQVLQRMLRRARRDNVLLTQLAQNACNFVWQQVGRRKVVLGVQPATRRAELGLVDEKSDYCVGIDGNHRRSLSETS